MYLSGDHSCSESTDHSEDEYLDDMNNEQQARNRLSLRDRTELINIDRVNDVHTEMFHTLQTIKVRHATKYVLIPTLCFVCMISILQLILCNLNITIQQSGDDVIILNLFGDPATFSIAFFITLTLTVFASIISLYGEYKWSFVLMYDNRKRQTEAKYHKKLKMKIKKSKVTIHKNKIDIKLARDTLSKLSWNNNDLEAMAQHLRDYKQEIKSYQEEYHKKTKKKVFKNYIHELDQQYQDLSLAINENQLVILSTVLAEIKISNQRYIDEMQYNQYLSLCNTNTVKEFTNCGGYHGLKHNKHNLVDLMEFGNLIENVMDNIDDNQCTFVNY